LDRLAPESLAKNNLYGIVNTGILIYCIKITYLWLSSTNPNLQKQTQLFAFQQVMNACIYRYWSRKSFCLPLEASLLAWICLAVTLSPDRTHGPPILVCPLLRLLLRLLPLNQLKARPKDEPRFFLLACRARISVMSLGTRSPVELLLDILRPMTTDLWPNCSRIPLKTPASKSKVRETFQHLDCLKKGRKAWENVMWLNDTQECRRISNIFFFKSNLKRV